MKLIEMAKYHGREDNVKKLIEYCNDPNYVVKLQDPYDGVMKIVGSATYIDEKAILKDYDKDDEPFIGLTFVGHEDSDIYGPEDFVEQAQVYELKRII